MKRMSMQELADQVEWEGGVADAIDYGIKSSEVPLELEAEWKKAEKLLKQSQAIVERIAAELGLGG